MNDLFIFFIGTLVTLIVGSAVVILMITAAREPRQGVEVSYQDGMWRPRKSPAERAAAVRDTPSPAPPSAGILRSEPSWRRSI